MARAPDKRGTCDGCGKSPRLLTPIESGHKLCRTCLRRLHRPSQAAVRRPATAAQHTQAVALGFSLPPGVTQHDAEIILRCTRRQFEVTPALLADDVDRLFRLQDDFLGYVADVWEELTGRVLRESEISWWEQQKLAARFVIEHREVAEIIQRVQRQRERYRQAAEQEFARSHPPGEAAPWETFRAPIAADAAHELVVRVLRERWRQYLPRRPGLLARLMRGGAAPERPAPDEEQR
jgi:RNAse (barnase) inhibitor barstar